MLALVGEQLSGAVEDVVALGPDAVDVVAHLGEAAVLERAHLVLHELLEAVAGQLLVLDVVALVLLHVALVLEGEPAAGPAAVEVGGALAEEGAVAGAALFRRPESLEALLDDGRVFSVVVGVHLHVGGGDVDLVAPFFDTMIVGLLFVVGAVLEAVAAVVQGAVTHEAVLQGLVPFLVPLEVAYHLLLFDEHPGVAVQTMEVLAIVQVFAVGAAALQRRGELLHVLGVVQLAGGLVEEQVGGDRFTGDGGRHCLGHESWNENVFCFKEWNPHDCV